MMSEKQHCDMYIRKMHSFLTAVWIGICVIGVMYSTDVYISSAHSATGMDWVRYTIGLTPFYVTGIYRICTKCQQRGG